MGSKNQPGLFECFEKLHPDEPFFVLRAQDRLAPRLVELWADEAAANHCPPEKVVEARAVALAMKEWPKKKRPD